MKVTVVRPGELGAAELGLWSQIQHSDAALSSPCLSPQFTRAISTLRDDIFVGVIEDGNRTVGFFPFERNAAGEAVGSIRRMADYEAVVALPDATWTAGELLRGCNLTQWNFEALVGCQEQLLQYTSATSWSSVLDLRHGFDAWLESIRRPGSRYRKHLHAQQRALERDLGSVRFESHADRTEALAWFRDCKSAHYRRTGKPDHFETPWVAAMVENVHGTQDEDFTGALSLLHAGDQIVAGHLGMRSRTVWHYWLPCYDRGFSKYSPGSLLLVEMARNAGQLGIQCIDLGRGTEDYKSRFSNGRIAIAAGTVSVDPYGPPYRQPSTAASHSQSPTACAST